MRRYVSEEVYLAFTDESTPLDEKTADAVAQAMKTWALERGATHYCHWFQPLTGSTAEKHDSFLSLDRDGNGILRLTGKQLMLGESDASSFPTGGLRGTAYARGYTAWDRTSPVFIKEEAAGTVLCIPTVFLSYTADALDTKTPLLRSMQALDRQARRLLRQLGKTPAQVLPYVGAEQEYFLIDREMYRKRPDLIYCGRTLFGAPAPKGQELDDQYFGIVRERQGAFMQEVNRELWKLGVPACTQHKEVAPAQHELACIYRRANIAVDQNQLVMETMQRAAEHHGLVCLLHEKPFAGVNGSGKHNNWSLGTEQGENLLDPSGDPLQFRLILACILAAVDDHADLLRLSAGNPGNDLRLGGQEAPPAIVSVYVDEALDPGDQTLDSGVAALPTLTKDTSDRNRTSPFAFTGNKFEFRMVGASDSVAMANTVLNTIVAEAFCRAADRLETAEDPLEACRALTRELLERHSRICFRGDGYSPEWVAEAQRRGLPKLDGMLDAIPALTEEKAITLFETFRVFTASELHSRAEVLYETYAKRIRMEAETMAQMVAQRFLPAAARFAGEMAACAQALGTDAGVHQTLQQRTCDLLRELSARQDALMGALHAAASGPNGAAVAWDYRQQVLPKMQALRQTVDALEQILPKDLWPVPDYGDLLFEV